MNAVLALIADGGRAIIVIYRDREAVETKYFFILAGTHLAVKLLTLHKASN